MTDDERSLAHTARLLDEVRRSLPEDRSYRLRVLVEMAIHETAALRNHAPPQQRPRVDPDEEKTS